MDGGIQMGGGHGPGDTKHRGVRAAGRQMAVIAYDGNPKGAERWGEGAWGAQGLTTRGLGGRGWAGLAHALPMRDAPLASTAQQHCGDGLSTHNGRCADHTEVLAPQTTAEARSGAGEIQRDRARCGATGRV